MFSAEDNLDLGEWPSRMETPDVKRKTPPTNARSGAEETPLEGRVKMLGNVGQTLRWLWRVQRWLSEHLGHCSNGPIGQK